jgi:hypothetical protein
MMLRELDLAKLNSMTKYPSIPTYHTMGNKGMLTDEVIALPDTPVFATEKVDGTNSRIVCLPDETFVIGSREELLHARGDVIWNPALGIVDALRPAADRLLALAKDSFNDNLWVFYLEVFGGRVTANSKQYTGEHRVGFRLFDVVRFGDYRGMFERSVEEIARWRDSGGQTYLAEAELQVAAEAWGFELTPRISIDGVPNAHGEVLEWLRRTIPKTQCRLDEKGSGTPEGLVVRTSDRSTIFKIRFEDYERHQRRSSKDVK